MNNNRILITSPSLNVKENVSGISSLVSDIIQNSRLNFEHFQLGSKDGIKKNFLWAISQVNIYLKILFISLFRKYEFVHLNVGLEKPSIIRDSLVFIIVNKLFRKKVVLHIHGGYYLMHETTSKLLNYLLRQNFNSARAIIVLSDLEKDILSKRYGKLPFNVFPNAVNTTSLNGITKRSVHTKLRLVFMARVIKTKGVFTISDSLQYLDGYFDRFMLDIYGAGPDLEEWTAALNKYPALKFTYHGVVGGKDKWNALQNSDVLLLPSLSGEGMPIAMIEAMAVGCGVIVTDIASVKSVITDNVNGILLPESSPEQLAGKIKDLIDGRIDLKVISDNAKAYVDANLSLSGYINRLEQLYSTL
jgi:glycosyltransferase involved in cell wall biosynthesis